MGQLLQLSLHGFKSIEAMDLDLRPLNVLIGMNGAGKSNLVSFFKMLNEMMGERLQQFIATSGRAQSILRFGPKVTPQIEASLSFQVDNGTDTYRMRLFHAAGDTLIFAEEQLSFLRTGRSEPTIEGLGAGHAETRLRDTRETSSPIQNVLRRLLSRCRVYHFHDTSATARVRQYCYVDDNRWLMHDAGNLAAVLYRLRNEDAGSSYQRIVGTIRLIAPFFADFEIEPSGPGNRDVILNWREKGSDQVFGPHQLSDGTLRAICLITLLLQPETELPNLIIVDEPELGLHPYALNIIASLFQKAATHAQVLISTQSSAFLDAFEPEDVIIVNRSPLGSTFARADPMKLQAWLDEYSLGEVWEKNLVGGGPH